MKEIDPNKEPDRKRLIEASIRVANVKAAARHYELSEDEHIIYPINSSWTAGFVEAVITMVEDPHAANAKSDDSSLSSNSTKRRNGKWKQITNQTLGMHYCIPWVWSLHSLS